MSVSAIRDQFLPLIASLCHFWISFWYSGPRSSVIEWDCVGEKESVY